jgi:hypothetical protein
MLHLKKKFILIMRKKILLYALLITGTYTVHAQLVVKINGKAITEGQQITADNIKKMEVSFANPKKLKSYSLGKVVLLVDFENKEQENYIEYKIVKNGGNAIDAFLEGINTPFILFDEEGKEKDLKAVYNLGTESNFFKLLEKGKMDARNLKFKVKVSLYFKDKIGYEQYGDAIDLVKPVNFLVNNGSADGSIAIVGTGLKITADAAIGANYFGQYQTEEELRLPVAPLTTKNVTVVNLKKGDREYDRIYFNIVDTKGKSQDEVVESLKENFNNFLWWTSNICSKGRRKLTTMTDEVENGWLQFLGNNNISRLAPSLNKEENKEWDKEIPMKPVTVGKFKGYKFASHFRLAFCKSKVTDREFGSHASIYVVKHPNNNAQVIIIFNKEDNARETPEKAKEVEDKVEKFISTLIG